MSKSLYTYSPETLTALNKFRFASARATSVQAVVYSIEKSSYEINAEGEVFESIEELIEDLPDTAPRFVLLSYPKKSADGRLTSPFVLLYWIPPTSGSESKMLYAGGLEEFRVKAGVAKVIKLEDEEDFEDLEAQL